MSNPTTTATPAAPAIDPNDAQPNVAEATPAEAELIAQGLTTDADGNPIDAAAQEAAAKAAADAAAAQAAAEAEAAAKAAADAAAAEAAQAAAPAPAAAPTPAPLPVLPPKPEPPQDFAAERAKLKELYEGGDLDQDEYLEKREAITLSEAEHRGRLAAWEQQAQAVQQAAEATFDAVASQWATDNADFVANPLRAKAMQDAINEVDRQTGGKLSPADLFAQAQKIAFEAFNYTPAKPAGTPAAPAAPAKSPEQIAADALKERKPDTSGVPGTLAAAPQAGGLDPRNSNYAVIDNGHISDAEDIIARMTPEQVDAMLRDTAGATTTGTGD